MYKKMLKCADIITKLHNLLVIALVIIRRTHKAQRTDGGAENPTRPKLPDFTLQSNFNGSNPFGTMKISSRQV